MVPASRRIAAPRRPYGVLHRILTGALLALPILAGCAALAEAPVPELGSSAFPAPSWSWRQSGDAVGGSVFEAVNRADGLRIFVTPASFRFEPAEGARPAWDLLVVPRALANPVDPGDSFALADPATLAAGGGVGRVWYSHVARGFLRGIALPVIAGVSASDGGVLTLDFDLGGSLTPVAGADGVRRLDLRTSDGTTVLTLSARAVREDGAETPARLDVIPLRPSADPARASGAFGLRLTVAHPDRGAVVVEMLFATPEALAMPGLEDLAGDPDRAGSPVRPPSPVATDASSGLARALDPIVPAFLPPAEINDTLRLFRSGSATGLAWSDAPGPYSVYRGSRASGSPWAYNHACTGVVSSTAATDSLNPPPGGLFYYLVARNDLCNATSVVGRDSAGTPVPSGPSCVTPTTCSAIDACHSAGACDPSTGVCSTPSAADGTPCATGEACAPMSVCQSGACITPGAGSFVPASKPYFMVIADTSSSESVSLGTASACGYGTTRGAHLRCGLKSTVQTYAGLVNFGLSGYAENQTGCSAGCYTGCTYGCYTAEMSTTGQCLGCGPRTAGDPTTRAGAKILLPVQQDNWWTAPPNPSNASAIVSWLDNDCTGNTELWPSGSRPVNGALRDMKRYFSAGWTSPDGAATYPTPLSTLDRACRAVSVILIAAGDESCDAQADAVAAAQDLFQNGVVIGPNTFHVRTYVIRYVAGTQTNADQIAAAGGTGSSIFVTNETQLSQTLAGIVQGAVQPELCDNVDNDCNGCVDEGFKHYADVAQTCCPWSSGSQRSTCLQNYQFSITQANPRGDTTLLPCTTVAQQSNPSLWLCVDPGDPCDGVDNNGQNGIDDGAKKCGSPLHCPQPEVCNGQDDDCNGLIDDGPSTCPNGCVWHPEVCDGCDNDCDGVADNGVPPVSCGPPLPANCRGQRFCSAPVPVTPGTCVAGGYGACLASPQPETCDGIDNDCNGLVDDSPSCPCATRPEACNGIDDNCNSQIDEGVVPPSPVDVCGVSPLATTGECTSQVQVVCQGGGWHCIFPAGVCNGPGGCAGTPEICDTLDNNCNGLVNENVRDFGAPCASDDGLGPPGHGRCRTTGTRVCNGTGATSCSAVKANCATLPGGCTELCDGVDNDCDGFVDESTVNKGAASATFVKPNVTKIGASLWIDSYEVSRPSATPASAGTGNGYACAVFLPGDPYCGDSTVPLAPAGAPLDKTTGCSEPGRMPWYGLTPVEAAQVCKGRGGRLCSTAELQAACTATASCTFGYNPRGAACTTSYNASTKFCNLGPAFDTSPPTAGDQDDPIATANAALPNCWADWSGLQGNTAATSKIFDITGNLREIAKVGTGQYTFLGGAFDTDLEAGAACTAAGPVGTNTTQLTDTGFRCCYDANPSP